MTYKTSLDKTAQIITSFVTLIFVVIIIFQYLLSKDMGNVATVIIPLVFLLIYAVSFGLRPVSYIVNYNEVIIHRPISDVKIKRNLIKSAEIIDKDEIKGSIRTLGNGGLFGYYGKFTNYKLGKMTWYATRRDKIILIETNDNRKIILTPDDPQRMIAELNNQ